VTAQTEVLGRLLVVAGVVLVVAGLLVLWAKPLRLGGLPGDFSWSARGWQVYFPLATCIILSLVATLVLNLVFRRR
jgi:low affinity Fe/Cu permease